MTATDVATASSEAQSGKSCPNSKEASPVKVKTPSEVKEEATNLLMAGKRHMLVSDIPAAVTSLAQACELLSAQFGETAVECAESYFRYGKALLELSRLESGVLGNALEGVPEEDDANTSQVEDPEKMTEDEKNEVEEKVGEALEENFQSLQKKDDKKDEEKKDDEKEGEKKDEARTEDVKDGDKKDEKSDVKVDDKKDEKMEGTEDEGMEEGDDSQDEEKEGDESKDEGMEADDSTAEEATEGKEQSDEKKDEEEEPSNLQLAWEMLELAKVVYTKQVESGEGVKAELEEKLCSTMLALGEVSIENENYSQAVEDIKLCLKKQENLPKGSRIVAETHYQLGLAQGFHSQFDDAVDNLNCAVKIIKEKIESVKEAKKDSPSEDAEKEMAELEALIPEIEEKIVDTKDMKKEAEAKSAEGSEEGLKSSSTTSSGDVKNVSSIAVKRKVEDDGDNQAKKLQADSEKTAAAS